MGSATESVFDQNKPSVAALNDHRQIATVPTQGRRAVGLLPVEMAQLQTTAATKVLQLHGRSAALVNNHCQLAAVSTEGGLLLLFRQKGAWSSLSSAATPGHQQANQQQQRRGADQSSKRELLSRGRELRGGVRPESWGRESGGVPWPG